MDKKKIVDACNHVINSITIPTATKTRLVNVLATLATADKAALAGYHDDILARWNAVADTQGTSAVKDFLYALERATKPDVSDEDIRNALRALAGALTKQQSTLVVTAEKCDGWRDDVQVAEIDWQKANIDSAIMAVSESRE
jgi:hypothetical protein